ncbi:MAG: hypothetical protein H6735_03480 [Alphaproteobacteria bacterium]|nr:hypothetical protein [Alphaproteobacteria bacterium]
MWWWLACSRALPPPGPPGPDDPLAGVVAWAELLAAVRWFHPADEAVDAPWSAIAAEGVAIARAAPDAVTLRDGWTALLTPYAPTVQLWTGDLAPPPLVPPSDAPPMAWQHLGYGLGANSALYTSLRTGRTDGPTGTLSSADAVNGSPAKELRGRTIRLSTRLRVESDGTGVGRFWLITDRGPPFSPIAEEGIDDTDRAWHGVTLEHTVEPETRWVHFGFTVTGRTHLWADDLRWEARADDGSWYDVPLNEPGFDEGGWWWGIDGSGYDAAVVEDHGNPVLSIAHHDLGPRRLFDALPGVGESLELDLGRGLHARVPLALPADTEPAPPGRLLDPLSPDRDDVDVRLAAMITAWGVLRSFHPEPPAVDWDVLLERSVRDAAAAADREELVAALWRMAVDVPDGHTWIGHPKVTGGNCAVPFRWLRVDDALVVTSTVAAALRIGDVVLSVDGVPTADALRTAEARVSGSERFRHAWAAERLSVGPCDRAVTLEIDRGGERTTVAVGHAAQSPPLFDRAPFDVLEDGVIVVDLNQLDWESLRGGLDQLAAAPGVVFDLREYPAGGITNLLPHLLSAPDQQLGWMQVPQVIRPGEVAGWAPYDWRLQPASPRIGGRVAFLSSPLDLSASESVLAMVVDQQLGTVIGGTTGGTNGNIVQAPLPGGYGLQFTGMHVVRADGSPVHLVGIAPDVPVSPTLDGLRAGRDEVLEAGLAWVRSQD